MNFALELLAAAVESVVDEAGPTVGELLIQWAAVVGAVLTLGGLAWWLLKPRVEDWVDARLGKLTADTAYSRQQLDPTETGSTASQVRQAAELAEHIPALMRRVTDLEEEVEPLPALASAVRSQEVELIDHRRRLGNLEEAVITGRITQP